MKTVWKFPLMLRNAVALNPIIEVPQSAEIIDLGVEDDKVYAWAKVDADNELKTEKRQFYLRQTGSELDFPSDTCRYVGSARLFAGNLVFHVWEVPTKAARASLAGVDLQNAKDVGAVFRMLDDLNKRLSGLEADFPTQISTRVASLESSKAAYSDELEARLQALESSVTAPGPVMDDGEVEAVRTMLTQQIVALEDRLKVLETVKPSKGR